jgi:hypothetical protein
MTLPVAIAERILRARFDEPAKPPTQYVIGFRTPDNAWREDRCRHF